MGWSWNGVPRLLERKPSVQDETLRDGIQSASATDPTLDEKIELLYAMEALGVEVVNVGLPAASHRNREHVQRLCEEIVASKLKIRPAAAGRTVVADLIPIVEVSQRVGIGIEVCTFIGCSPIRQLAESWDLARILRQSGGAIAFAAKEGLEVCYVTEDTTRSRPDVLAALFCNAIDQGARRLCLADTVGHATPDGVQALVTFTRDVLAAAGHRDVGIDFHGHNDRGLVLMNSLAALAAGADRVHGCALGIGERSGNAPLELLLLNMDLAGGRAASTDRLARYCSIAARALRWTLPPNHPFSTTDSGDASRPASAEAATTSGLAR